MGFWDFLKPRSKEHVEACWPGGKMLQVHMEYDTEKTIFTYFGRFGLTFNISKSQLTGAIVKEISRTHSVLQVYSGVDCVGTTDILPTEACNIMKDWLGQY
ncbi:hypothetical protein [Veillonella sp.]|uniref:hypothetical protein n=1 Tax=Veillonella sp. TaxID=1926307 RepID=UPI0025DA191E|nr:hypothetical protein [Veillonella sp.]